MQDLLRCPVCQSMNAKENTTCSSCSAELPSRASQRYCGRCGVDLSNLTAVVIRDDMLYCMPCAKAADTAETETLATLPDIPTEVDSRLTTKCASCGATVLASGVCPNCTMPRPDAHAEARKNVDDLLQNIAAQSHYEERYIVRGELARGGMGVVLEAYDVILQRPVAIKMLRSELNDTTAASRGQFLKEARVGGRLLHPNLLAVFDLGVNLEGRIYYTMRLVDGASLQSCLESVHQGVVTRMVSFPLINLVEAFKKACEGIDYANQNGVIHLDIKPQNILVSGFSEVFAIDWGLARVDDHDDSSQLLDIYQRESSGLQTASATMAVDIPDRQVVGTPAYMSPEQAQGLVAEFGPSSDVYGLGGILHFILYNAAPNRGASVDDMLTSSTVTKTPGKLRTGIMPRGRRVPQAQRESIRELESICFKALEVRQEDRFEDAEQLIVELEEWLSVAKPLQFP